jgi:hypothetical protein
MVTARIWCASLNLSVSLPLSWILSLLPSLLALTENALLSLNFHPTQQLPSQPIYVQNNYPTTTLQTIPRVPTKQMLTRNPTILHQICSHQHVPHPAPGGFTHTGDVTPFHQSFHPLRTLTWTLSLLAACMLSKCPMPCSSLPLAPTPHFLRPSPSIHLSSRARSRPERASSLHEFVSTRAFMQIGWTISPPSQSMSPPMRSQMLSDSA